MTLRLNIACGCLLLSSVFLAGASGAVAETELLAAAARSEGVTAAPQSSESSLRRALVVANGAYAEAPLPHVAGDAQVMATTLNQLGFAVEVNTNLNANQMKKRFAAFGKHLKHGGVGFVYFAGHAVQLNGVNYLLPVDVKGASNYELRTKGVDVRQVLSAMAKAKSSAGIVVLDAGRKQPFTRKQGLASMKIKSGSVVVFAAEPDNTFGSADSGDFVEELKANLSTPDLNVTQAFKLMREGVRERTDGLQVPWVAADLNEDFPMVRVPRTGLEMVRVPGGCFKMGDFYGDGAEDEKPVREVCVSDFALGKYEVTQGLWRQIMGNNPSMFARCGDECPVENVTWQEVQEFIAKLNEREGTASYRLPTEAEWEYAAKSGGRQEKFSGGDRIAAVGWYSGNSGSRTHPAGQKQPNGLGIFDMSGNVWEWVEDWYARYPEQGENDPIGPAIGADRAARGGCWGGGAAYVRTMNRMGVAPGSTNGFLGFRLAAYVDR